MFYRHCKNTSNQHRTLAISQMLHLIPVGLCAALAGSALAGPSFYPATGEANSVVAADVDWDGDLDLIVGSNGNVDVFINSGNGVFFGPVEYTTGLTANDVVADDLNGDQRIDLVCGGSNGSISVLFGNGDGTFQAPIIYAVANEIYGLALGDIDNDGDLDVAAGGESTEAEMHWYKNDGHGGLTLGFTYRINQSVGRLTSIECGDLDDDGNLDLAATYQKFDGAFNARCSDVLLFNDGGGMTWTMQEYVSFKTTHDFGGPIWNMKLADLDGDGDLDIFHQAFYGDTGTDMTVEALLNRGAREFIGPYKVFQKGIESGRGLAVGDMKNIGHLDLVYAIKHHGRLRVYWIRKMGKYQYQGVLGLDDRTHETPLDQLAVDLNGDGALDSVTVCDNGILVALNPLFQYGPTLVIDSMVRGESADLSLSNASIGRIAFYLYSSGEPTYSRGISAFGGMSLNLSDSYNMLGTRTVDENGDALMTVSLPLNFPYDALTLQVVVRDGQRGEKSRKSNFVYTTVTD